MRTYVRICSGWTRAPAGRRPAPDGDAQEGRSTGSALRQSIVSGPSAEPLRNWRTNGLPEENIRSASPASTIRPAPQHGDVFADLTRRGDVVRDDDVRAFVDRVHLLDQVAQQRRADRVQARVGLVEDHDVRLHHERAREAGALAHPAGELRRRVVHRVGQADVRQPLGDALGDLLPRPMSVCWRSGNATLSNTDIDPNSAPSWNSTPICGAARAASASSASARVRRARRRRPSRGTSARSCA